MSEKMPQFERPEPVIVGPASVEKKEEYKQTILGRFGEHHYDQIANDKKQLFESLEYQKKPYEKLAIEEANEITNSIISDFGLRPFDISERNIHIVPDKLYKEIEGDSSKRAVTIQELQMIILNAERIVYPVERASTIFHEIIHLKTFLSIEAHEDLYGVRRCGLEMSSSRKKEEKTGFFIAFSGLNEAVVSEIQKRYFPELLRKNQFLVDEYNWGMSEEARVLKEEKAKEEKADISEIAWVTKDGKDYGGFPYRGQRKVLNYIADVLYEENAGEFSSRDEVMRLFFKAHFDGKSLPIARLIEKSFGKGSFRMVGMMDDKLNSARLVRDYLTKHKNKKSSG